jgi:hypothetical protein
MQSDIAKIISIIDQRIETLRDLRNKLVHEFGSGEESKAESSPQSVLSSDEITRFPRLPAGNGSGNGKRSRKDEITDFIRTHGPQTRAQIIAQVAIPRGTLAYVLNDRERFRRLRDGTWTITGEQTAGGSQ